MSYGLIMDLTRRARTHPPRLMIEDDEVLPLARYAARMIWQPATIPELADQIRAGKMQLFGIPVHVR